MTRIGGSRSWPGLRRGGRDYGLRGRTASANVSNQNWAVAVEDDLNRENGIPLFVQDDPTTPEDEGDGWISRSMPSWNPDGTAVTFWESGSASDGSHVWSSPT